MSRWLSTFDHQQIPSYVLDRMRRVPPMDVPVVPNSIPVVAFGNPETSRVATLGINPSSAEFLSETGELLAGPAQRFETIPSLGANPLDQAEPATIAAAVESCYRYFEHRPYGDWFSPLDVMLQAINASYWTGSACHLDLVQWATEPKWGGLTAATRKRAIQADKQFLLDQLHHLSLERLLLNGRTVVNTYLAVVGPLDQLPRSVSIDGVTSQVFRGRLNGTIVIGWSVNYQSSWGLTTRFREALVERIAKEAA